MAMHLGPGFQSKGRPEFTATRDVAHVEGGEHGSVELGEVNGKWSMLMEFKAAKVRLSYNRLRRAGAVRNIDIGTITRERELPNEARRVGESFGVSRAGPNTSKSRPALSRPSPWTA
jgi:hypothetical protein